MPKLELIYIILKGYIFILYKLKDFLDNYWIDCPTISDWTSLKDVPGYFSQVKIMYLITLIILFNYINNDIYIYVCICTYIVL